MGTFVLIGFIDFVLKGKTLLDYTNFFFSDQIWKWDKIILRYSITKNFFYELVLKGDDWKNMLTLKYHTFSIIHYFSLISV